MRRLVSALSLTLAFLVALPGLASARGPANAYLELERLEASEDVGAVVVDLRVTRDSWRWLREHRITPTALVTVTLDRGRHEDARVTLERASQRITVAVPRGARIQGAEVRFAGRSRAEEIGWFRIGGLDLVSARLRVAPRSVLHGGGGGGTTTVDEGGHGHGGNGGHGHGGGGAHGNGGHGGSHGAAGGWNSDPAVIAACGRATSSPSRCLELMASSPVDPTPVITACGEAFRGYDADVAQCLADVARIDFEASGLVTSCKQAFGAYSSDVHACIVEGGQARRGRAAAAQVDACKRAFGAYSSDVHTCIRDVAPTRYDASGLVDACKRAFGAYSSDVHACTTEMREARYEPTAAIDACKGLFGAYSSDVHACLRTAAGARRDPAAAIRACGGSSYTSEKQRCVTAAAR